MIEFWKGFYLLINLIGSSLSLINYQTCSNPFINALIFSRFITSTGLLFSNNNDFRIFLYGLLSITVIFGIGETLNHEYQNISDNEKFIQSIARFDATILLFIFLIVLILLW